MWLRRTLLTTRCTVHSRKIASSKSRPNFSILLSAFEVNCPHDAIKMTKTVSLKLPIGLVFILMLNVSANVYFCCFCENRMAMSGVHVAQTLCIMIMGLHMPGIRTRRVFNFLFFNCQHDMFKSGNNEELYQRSCKHETIIGKKQLKSSKEHKQVFFQKFWLC